MKGIVMKIDLELLQKYSLPFLLLYMLLIITGSLWPRLSRHYQTGEISSGQIPKEGDNFKMVNDPAVYRLEDGTRRQYKSDTAFFNHSNNKPFDTPYEDGGILICDKEVVLSFPMGDYMPKEPGERGEAYFHKNTWQQLKESIFRRDKLSHFLAYGILAILCLWTFQYYRVASVFVSNIVALLLVISFGAGIEELQFAYIPGRDKELLDLLFNVLGGGIGLLIYHYWIRKYCQQKIRK